jgi:ubiquinone/menaquinone biosynthesis C-methylase UbiE
LAAVDRLPDYAPMLADYHRAFAPELRAMVASLPLRAGDRVLELACGDGFYVRWLAERVGPSGFVTALDASPAFLELARGNAAGHGVGLVAADARAMPFRDDTFDLVWCAQSLFSLPDPVEAVRLMRRVVRPGGVVAVLENDSLHEVLLPWPVEVELAVRAAELAGFAAESDRPWKFYVGRQLFEVFRKAGLTDLRKQSWAVDREAPLSDDLRSFLGGYLDNLRQRTRPHLDPSLAARFEALADPRSGAYLLDQPDLTVTCLVHLVLGTKPAGDGDR